MSRLQIIVEESTISSLARQLLQEAKTHKLKFLLPMDHVVADRVDANAVTCVSTPAEAIHPL